MPATTISSTINSVVTLDSGSYFSPLYITSTGAILATPSQGAILIPMTLGNFVISNDGTVDGGLGTAGAMGSLGNGGGGGTAGGTGINAVSPGTIQNTQMISGGAGGAGGTGGAGLYAGISGIGGAGGAGSYGNIGGTGIRLVEGSIQNAAIVTGGVGGDGGGGGLGGVGSFGGAGGFGGYGGAGGEAIYLKTGYLQNFGEIIGGAGGNGGAGGPGGAGQASLDNGSAGPDGSGGVGGAGIYVKINAAIENSGNVLGGMGGTGLDGGGGGIGINIGSGSVQNIGTIQGGAGGRGQLYGYGGAGGDGLYLLSGDVVNTGTLSGGAGGSVGISGTFGAGGDGVDIIYGSLQNIGEVNGGDGGLGGSGAKLHGGAVFYNTGIILGGSFEGGGTGQVGGVGVVIDGGTLFDSGTISGGTENGGRLADAVYFIGPGTLIREAGAQFYGSVVANISMSDTLVLSGSENSGFQGLNGQFEGFNDIQFAPSSSLTVVISLTNVNVNETFSGFSSGDKFVIYGFAESLPTFSSLGLVLGPNKTLNFGGDSLDRDFGFSESGGNTTIELAGTIACFCAGTLIATPNGKTPVEKLSIGSMVCTLNGVKVVKWIGRRDYDGRFIAGNHMALPVKICARALGQNSPSRDLYLSPGHALFYGGTLIPSWRLINGASIQQLDSVQRVEYFHIELESHEVIFAEDTPVESFLDENCRSMFQNADEFRKLYPGSKNVKALMPRTDSGFGLYAIQRLVAARAGQKLNNGWGRIRGFVDDVGPKFCAGWAQFVEVPEAPVTLDIFISDKLVSRVLANEYRGDLRTANLGSGCHGFTAVFPKGVSGKPIVCAAGTNQHLTPTKAVWAA